MIPREQPFIENKFCQESGSKFNAKSRRHHCRHCGRSLMKKHSDNKIVIAKFPSDGKKQKPVRVCDPCFLVLSGAADEILKAKDPTKRRQQAPGGGGGGSVEGSPRRPLPQQQQQQQQERRPTPQGSPERSERKPQPGAMQREMEDEEARERRQSGQSVSSAGSAPGGRGASGAMPSWASNNTGGGGGGGGDGAAEPPRNNPFGAGGAPPQQSSQPPNNPFASSQGGGGGGGGGSGFGASGAMPAWASNVNNAVPAGPETPVADALPSWANGGAEGGNDSDSDDDL